MSLGLIGETFERLAHPELDEMTRKVRAISL